MQRRAGMAPRQQTITVAVPLNVLVQQVSFQKCKENL
jgi:hypothetical protein